jgi:hypothetical protein
MHMLAYILAALIAGAIIFIGALYIARPRVIAASFGLPRPGGGAETDSWLRLKGVRDVAAGLVIFALMIWGGSFFVGLILIVDALIPIGDMLTILAARGSRATAFGVHGVTAAVMLAVGISLVQGWA